MKQEASIGRLLCIMCLYSNGSVTLFTLGCVDMFIGKKFKSMNGRGQSPTTALLRRRLELVIQYFNMREKFWKRVKERLGAVYGLTGSLGRGRGF